MRKRKLFQLEKRKYFQFELGNWEMTEQQEQEDENKRIGPRERALGQKFYVFYGLPLSINIAKKKNIGL